MDIEAPLQWTKSTMSATSDCVEWARNPRDGNVFVRNSREPDGPWLEFTPSEWQAFVAGLRQGEGDL